MKVTNKTINIKTYEQAAQYLLQMFSDGMLSFEDYSTQLDKLGNMYLKKVDAPNLITRIITTVTRNKGEEILVSFDEEVKVKLDMARISFENREGLKEILANYIKIQQLISEEEKELGC